MPYLGKYGMRYTELLEAERNYLLYHGTAIDYLIGMLLDNKVRGDYGSDGFHMGVSLTTTPRIAWGFAHNSEENFQSGCGYEKFPFKPVGCLLEFNSADLRTNFGLKRVRDGDSSEMEMRTFGHVTDLRTHLVGIVAHREHLEFFKELSLGDADIPPSPSFMTQIEWLLSSPLLREPAPIV